MSPPRVLLLWPGTEGVAAGNFGVPQLVTMATYLRARTGAAVDIVDLAIEKGLGPVSLPRLLAAPDGRGYDVIALGCYSSYDYLKCLTIAGLARAAWPRATICAGGYHVSARPTDIVFDGSPFDVAIVGEGERPMQRVVESVAGGAPLREVILGPLPIEDLDGLPPTDWSLLERYRRHAPRLASQVQLYLSRGCPFDCAFCMERAKREVSWRAYSVERALDEVARLAAFVDLRAFTVYFADALFGMRKAWRRELLEGLARSGVATRKLWLLIRVDMVEEEDLRLFAAANCGLGFGLESGDPAQLAIIRKAGRLDDYLERMEQIATDARRLDVPWGANVIVGHPGETEASLRRSADYLRRLFSRPGGTTGFLSVDPFRLYPGSPIDDERSAYEARYGARFHRPAWWHDGDQEFLSEWVDPSRELSYRRREALTAELFQPILESVPHQFRYGGPARDYFERAITEQIQLGRAGARLHYVGRYYAWQRYLGRSSPATEERAGDAALREVALGVRAARWPLVAARASLSLEDAPNVAGRLESAIVNVPRELFVPLDHVADAARDVAVPLDPDGRATVSAMHAYVRSFSLLGVGPGDRVADLGCGTGYGTALLAALVGPSGRVVGVEIDPDLAARARENLAANASVEIVTGDALSDRVWRDLAGIDKVTAGFALEELTPEVGRGLPEGAVFVGPVGSDTQRLARAVRTGAGWAVELFEEVRYVADRGVGSPAPTNVRARTRLPLVSTT